MAHAVKIPEGQIARWLEILSSYDMKIEHRAGRLHKYADGFSRIPCGQCGLKSSEDEEDFPTAVNRLVTPNKDDRE